MKAKTFKLVNNEHGRRQESIKLYALLKSLPLDKVFSVRVSNYTSSKQDNQRGLNWMWNLEVAKSGIGGANHDTAEGVHLDAKWRFARPILLRDSKWFRDLYEGFEANHVEDRATALKWFCENIIHTEKMTVSQNAEFLTDFQRYWIGKGVNLTEPKKKELDYEQV